MSACVCVVSKCRRLAIVMDGEFLQYMQLGNSSLDERFSECFSNSDCDDTMHNANMMNSGGDPTTLVDNNKVNYSYLTKHRLKL